MAGIRCSPRQSDFAKRAFAALLAALAAAMVFMIASRKSGPPPEQQVLSEKAGAKWLLQPQEAAGTKVAEPADGMCPAMSVRAVCEHRCPGVAGANRALGPRPGYGGALSGGVPQFHSRYRGSTMSAMALNPGSRRAKQRTTSGTRRSLCVFGDLVLSR